MIFVVYHHLQVYEKISLAQKLWLEMFYMPRKHPKTTESSGLTKRFQPIRLDLLEAKIQKNMIFLFLLYGKPGVSWSVSETNLTQSANGPPRPPMTGVGPSYPSQMLSGMFL